MKISSENLAARQATTVAQLNDLMSALKQLDSLPARVISNAQGQLLIATRFGNIQPQNQLPLQAGQQVTIRLNQTTGQPTVSPVKAEAATQTLSVANNRELAQLLRAQKPTLAKVVKQSSASTQLRISGLQIAMPRMEGLTQNQLLSVRLSANGGQIELQPLDRKPLLKALLSQLISRSGVSDRSSSPLVDLFRLLGNQVSSASTGRSQTAVPSAASSLANTAPTVSTKNAAAGSPQLQGQSLLQLLPQLSVAQANSLRQWIAPFIQQQPSVSNDNTAPPVNPLRLLQQLANGTVSADRLQQLLNVMTSARGDKSLTSQSQPTQAEARSTTDRPLPSNLDSSRLTEQVARQPSTSQQGQSAARESQLNLELLQLQGREAARLVEQIGNQTQTQRTSISLQQEIQQPLTFALSLPVLEGKQIRQLDIAVEQRNQAADPDKRAWDVRLSFEFGVMGMVSCHIFLVGEHVSSSFYCEREETHQQFEASLPSFRQQLIQAGFEPGEINSYNAPPKASPVKDPLRMSESILDIEV